MKNKYIPEIRKYHQKKEKEEEGSRNSSKVKEKGKFFDYGKQSFIRGLFTES